MSVVVMSVGSILPRVTTMKGSNLPAAVAAAAAGVWVVSVVAMSVVMSVPRMSTAAYRDKYGDERTNDVGAVAAASSTAAYRDEYGDERTNNVGAACSGSLLQEYILQSILQLGRC